jgi:hypothetical protein
MEIMCWVDMENKISTNEITNITDQPLTELTQKVEL